MLFSFWDETEFILSSETQEQSVSKGAAFKIHVSNAEQREAESGEAKEANPWASWDIVLQD